MRAGEAANRKRGKLVGIHFNAAVRGCDDLIRKLRAKAFNLARLFVVNQGADRRRTDVQGQYRKVSHDSNRIGIVLERVLKTLTRYNMFKPGDRVGVAVSGGADSVFLLHALFELAPRWDLALSVLHLN